MPGAEVRTSIWGFRLNNITGRQTIENQGEGEK